MRRKPENTSSGRKSSQCNNVNNHAVRSQNWHYIRYADGAQELYDKRHDPHEWTNLAPNVKYAKVI